MTSFYLVENENPHAPIRANGKRGWYKTTRSEQIRGITMHAPQALPDFDGDDSTAENVADYFKIVDRPASTHSSIDSDSVVDLLPDEFTAFHAAGVNSATLGIEVGWLYDSWKDDDAKTEAAIRLAAAWCAPRCILYDIPPVRITDKAKWENGARGFLEHSITETWRGQPGRRRDPGPDFPWDFFFEVLTLEINARLTKETQVAQLTKYEQDAVDALLAEGIFTEYSIDEENELHEPVLLKTLAVFLKRILDRPQPAASTDIKVFVNDERVL